MSPKRSPIQNNETRKKSAKKYREGLAKVIKKIRYRDLRAYLDLRNSCFYADPSLAPPISFDLADRIFFIVNKLLGYFLPVFKNRFNVFGYYVDDELVGFQHLSQRHIVWPYQIPDHSMQIYSELRAVEHKHRGKGIGKFLYKKVFDIYKDYEIFGIMRKDNIASFRSAGTRWWVNYDEATRYEVRLRHADYYTPGDCNDLVMCRKSPGGWRQVYDLYLESLCPEAAKLERPIPEYFKISWRYRLNLFLFLLVRFYDEAVYVWTEQGTGFVRMFAHVRSNLMTKQTELALIADRHASSEEVLSVRTLLVHLAETGQERVTTHVRSNHRSVHDALKNLGFTPEGEYVCRVRKVAAYGYTK